MKRLPLFPTLLTFVMLTVLISLGIWQLERRAWKHELIRQLEAAQSLPPLEPADFLAAMTGPTSVQYRRAELPCSPGNVLPYDLKGGSSAGGGRRSMTNRSRCAEGPPPGRRRAAIPASAEMLQA